MQKVKYKYKINEGTFKIESVEHIGYGISVIDTDSSREIVRIQDITESKAEITELASTCNKLRLSPEHLCDVIEDFVE